MKNLKLIFLIANLSFLVSFNFIEAQDCGIDLGSSKQTIRGFGGMNFPRWIADLTEAQAETAFGTGNGQIGLSILRISVSPIQSQWNLEVPTAARAAKYGAIVFATPWSPPASMKTNGSTIQGELKTSEYGAYSDYLKNFYDYMSSNGVSLYAISVQNEPDWLPDYESCGWSGSQIRTFLDNNASVIPTRIMAPETVHYTSSYMDAIAPSSQVDILANHAYGGSPTRYSSSKDHWMTEHYAPNSDANSANNWPEALETCKEVHDYLVNGYNAYVWWYIRRSYGLITEDGNVSKRGYVMSHYSKFVRPGFVRIDATTTPVSGVSVSAYKDGDKVVVVAINQNSSSKTINFNFSGNLATGFTKYETTSSSNVANKGSISGGSSMSNTLAGYSISTFVGTINGDDNDGTDMIWMEAECGNVGSSWNVNSDANASNDKYVTIQSGYNNTGSAPTASSDQITYNINITEAGNYNLYARVITPNSDDDSFWIRMDGGAWYEWNNIGPNSSWTWETVQTYNLSSGNHTLAVAYREDGSKLDKLFIGNTTPSGEGSVASNCRTNPVTYTLSTGVIGSGTVSGAGTYDEGTVVALTATPASGWVVSSWTGVDNSIGNTATVTMNSNKSVSVTFVENTTQTYTLTTNVVGLGTVSGAGTFPTGTSVTVTATPASGYVFEGWSGDASGTNTSVSITMDANKTVTATFVPDGDGDEKTCLNPTAISLAFTQNGVGEFCWFTDDAIAYVNSWNLNSLTINGSDFTNTWSDNMPARIDGGFYIAYTGTYSWAHFEASALKSAEPLANESLKEISVYPNPFDETIFIDLSGMKSINRLDILNSLGQTILTKSSVELSPDVMSFQLDNEGSLFIIQVYANDKVYTKSILKK